MSGKPGVRVLFYAINGTGLGHLTRLVAIARGARELLHALDLRAEFQILTTSEAPEVVVDFPVYKLPSKTMVSASDLDNREFVSSARLLISTLVASFRPDILVTDTVAEGSFQEFAWLRGYAQAAVFVDRHKDPQVATSELHLRHLELYDLVLVPDDEEQASRYPAPAGVRARRRFLGAVHGFRPEQTLSAAEVRRRFGVAEGRRLIYVSAGGGGAARAELEVLVDALREDPQNHLLVGYGPLDRGPRCYAANVTPLTEPELWRYFCGLDAALSAAGYNSYEELLAAKVPTVFYAQQKGLDRQDQRIALGLEQGYHLALAEGIADVRDLDPCLIRARVEQLFEPSSRLTLLDRLASRPAAEGALRGAVELLALHSGLPGSPLRRDRLYEVATLRRAQNGASAGAGFAPSVRWLESWREAVLTRSARDDLRESARRRWHEGITAESDRDDLSWGRELLRRGEQVGLPDDRWLDFLKAYGASTRARDLGEDLRQRQRLREALEVLDELDEAGEIDLGEALCRLRDGIRRADLSDALHSWTASLDAGENADVGWLLTALAQSPTRLSLGEVTKVLKSVEGSERE